MTAAQAKTQRKGGKGKGKKATAATAVDASDNDNDSDDAGGSEGEGMMSCKYVSLSLECQGVSIVCVSNSLRFSGLISHMLHAIDVFLFAVCN